jgi:hypothetical protein
MLSLRAWKRRLMLPRNMPSRLRRAGNFPKEKQRICDELFLRAEGILARFLRGRNLLQSRLCPRKKFVFGNKPLLSSNKPQWPVLGLLEKRDFGEEHLRQAAGSARN